VLTCESVNFTLDLTPLPRELSQAFVAELSEWENN
jgi:hypothetical protein